MILNTKTKKKQTNRQKNKQKKTKKQNTENEKNKTARTCAISQPVVGCERNYHRKHPYAQRSAICVIAFRIRHARTDGERNN